MGTPLPAAGTALRVVQFAPVWLPLTQNWMWHQQRQLPPEVDSHVVCRRAQNLDQFPVPHLHCLKREGRARYLAHQLRYQLGVLIGRRGFPYLGQQLRALRPQVVHSHFGNNGWKAHQAVRAAGCRHVVTFYGHDMSRLPVSEPVWRERYAELFAQPDTVFLCEGSAMGRSLAATLGCPPEKIITHHLGVDLERIAYAPHVWTAGQPLKVLIAAAFREKKGIPYALDALARIRADVPLEITIIGDAGDDQEKARILERLQRHGLQDCTTLAGFQPHAVMVEAMRSHHLFLSTSVTAADGDSEGGAPVALIDASALGIGIVSSRHCDIPEIVRDGQTGWLADERDVDGIVAAVRRWLDAGPEAWRAMLDAARAHMTREYDARVQGQRLAAIYRGERPA